MNTTSVPLTRRNKVLFICEAAENLGAAPVLRSWEKTGVPRALWQIPSDEVVYDLYVQAVQFAQPVNEHADEEEQIADQPNEQVGKKRGRPAMTADERAESARKKQEEMKKKRVGHTGPTLLELWKKK